MHELCLAIGGMTVGEMKERMSYAELMAWDDYVLENGPVNQTLRIEGAVARAVAPFLKGATAKDLMPWPKEPEQEATLDDFMSILKTSSKNNRRK